MSPRASESPPSASNGSGSEPTPSGFENASNARSRQSARAATPSRPLQRAPPHPSSTELSPAGWGRSPVRKQQERESQKREHQRGQRPAERHGGPPAGERARPNQQRVLRVLGRPDSDGDGNADREEDPADRIAGTSPDDKRTHGRERRDGDEVHPGCDCAARRWVSVQPGRAGLEADAQIASVNVKPESAMQTPTTSRAWRPSRALIASPPALAATCPRAHSFAPRHSRRSRIAPERPGCVTKSSPQRLSWRHGARGHAARPAAG